MGLSSLHTRYCYYGMRQRRWRSVPCLSSSCHSGSWGVDDPDKATGSDAEIDRAFETTYNILKIRIQALLALPLAELKGDPIQLQVELDHIGTLTI